MALRRYNSMKNIVYSLFLLKVYSKNSILETKIKKKSKKKLIFENNVKTRKNTSKDGKRRHSSGIIILTEGLHKLIFFLP